MSLDKALDWHPPAWALLAAIVLILGLGVLLSLLKTRPGRAAGGRT